MAAVELPTLDAHSALFLDFDGTLVELAERPDAVIVAPGLIDELAEMSLRLGGALAVISGRPIAQVDAHLSPLRLPVAGVHGVQRRDATGHTVHLEVPPLASAEAALRSFSDRHAGLLVEAKHGALALHYRLAPELETQCREAIDRVARDAPGMSVMAGKMVFELKPANVHKGHAVGAYLHEAPFLGRHPVYAGDDLTDEDAFIAVQARGGLGIKVGPGPSAARCRIDGPSALRDWLRAQLIAAGGIAHG